MLIDQFDKMANGFVNEFWGDPTQTLYYNVKIATASQANDQIISIIVEASSTLGRFEVLDHSNSTICEKINFSESHPPHF